MKILNNLNTQLKDNLQFRVGLLLFSILLIVIREPALFLHPRLWAEEGLIFYAFARHHSLWQIFTTIHVGYLTLFNSIVSAIQAKIFSPEKAAIISTYMGFFIQLIPAYIIIFSTHEFWDNVLKKIICVIIIILVTAPELWLNTTNSHFILGLITFLIMLINGNGLSVLQKYFFRLLLFLGGLTGPASILFTPSFLIKAYRDKNKEKYIQAGIISLCSIIQASIIVYCILFDNKYQRLSTHNYRVTANNFVIDNFSSLPETSFLKQDFFSISYISFFGILMVFFYIYLVISNRKNNEYLISLLSLLIVGVFSTLGSLNMAGSPRYAYIPTCILLIVITSIFFNFRTLKSKMRYMTMLVLIICLTSHIIFYKKTIRDIYHPRFPVWKNEVAKWRVDSTYNPRIHPGVDAWQVKM